MDTNTTPQETDSPQKRDGLKLGDFFTHDRTQIRFVVTGITKRMRRDGPPRVIVEAEPAPE